MSPLGKVVIGFVLVIVDFRIDTFDLVPDVVGWVVVLSGLMALAGRSRGFTVAAAAAGTALLLALVDLVAEPGTVLGMLGTVTATAVVFGTCTGVRALVADPSVRRTADRIRWADLVLTGIAIALGLAAGGEEVSVQGAAVGPLLVLVLVALAVVVWFLVFLWSLRHRPELVSGLGTADGLEPGTP